MAALTLDVTQSGTGKLSVTMPLLCLPRQAPFIHRVAQGFAVRGFRGSLRVWRVAERIVPLPSSATICVSGQPLVLNLSDAIAPFVYYGVYERWELDVLARVVRPGTTCVDVGSNNGLYTVAMQAAVGPAGSVIAFEPQVDLSDKLAELAERSDGAQVSVLAFALGSSNGTASLKLYPGHSARATLLAQDVEGTTEVQVAVRRMDDVDIVATLPEIEFLKIDVELLEADVLTGAAEILGSGRVRAALIEVSANWEDVAGAVARLGPHYQAFRVSARRRGWRYRPQLERLTPADIAGATRQFNLFVCRDDAIPSVLDLVGTG